MTSRRFQKLLEEAREHDDFWIANAQAEFTDNLQELMDRRGVTKSELARRIGSSPAYVTKVMRGSTNFTLATMVRLVRVLNGQLQIRACANEEHSKWIHVHGRRPERPDIQKQAFRLIPISLNDSDFERTDEYDTFPTTA